MYKEKHGNYSFSYPFIGYLVFVFLLVAAIFGMVIGGLVVGVKTLNQAKEDLALEKEAILLQIESMIDEEGNVLASQLILALGLTTGYDSKRDTQTNQPVPLKRGIDSCRGISDSNTCTSAKRMCNTLTECTETRSITTCQTVASQALSMCRLIE